MESERDRLSRKWARLAKDKSGLMAHGRHRLGVLAKTMKGGKAVREKAKDFVYVTVALSIGLLAVFGVASLIQHDQAVQKQLEAKANIVDVARALNEVFARLPQPTPQVTK